MMTKVKTGKSALWNYVLAIPIIIILMVNYSCEGQQISTTFENTDKTETVATMNDPDYTEEDLHGVLRVSKDMPRFPGCENEKDIVQRDECCRNKMFQYIFTHLRYPEEAKKNNIEGQVIARFIVSAEGNVEKIRILKDIGGGCGASVKNLLQSMNDMPEKWIPGVLDGKPVPVIYTLPIKFSLDDQSKK